LISFEIEKEQFVDKNFLRTQKEASKYNGGKRWVRFCPIRSFRSVEGGKRTTNQKSRKRPLFIYVVTFPLLLLARETGSGISENTELWKGRDTDASKEPNSSIYKPASYER